jgi:hypothetical protein
MRVLRQDMIHMFTKSKKGRGSRGVSEGRTGGGNVRDIRGQVMQMLSKEMA